MFKGLLKSAGGWASGLNWWKLGAYALVAGILFGGGYMMGKHNCEQKHLQEQVDQWKGVVGTVTKEVQVRVPVVQKIEVESAKQRARIADLSEQLQNATAKRPENPSCDLSDDEFNLMQRAASETRTP